MGKVSLPSHSSSVALKDIVPETRALLLGAENSRCALNGNLIVRKQFNYVIHDVRLRNALTAGSKL